MIQQLLGGGYAPHGYCLLWRPWLVWTMAISDVLIALAYFSIPIALVTFVRRRRDVEFSGIFWLFALFIMACGLTHVVALWNLWNGAYQLEAIVKAITAAASVLTAILLWPLLPKAIALPSPTHLRLANEALRAEIVEREKAEAALVQARKMEAIGQLTGGIAHDFNNLLQAVSGSLDLVASRTANDERVQHLVDMALSAVDRGRRLTSQLMSFSRVQRIELKPVRVADLLAGIKELLARTIDPSVELSFDIDEAPHGVLADSVQFELALLNLALNARDAMPGGGKLHVEVRNRTLEGRDDVDDDDYVGITVTDTGTGMTPDVIARAFEPFFTTKPVGQGSGLGLSMVFGMARQSGGTVTIESVPDRGSSITIFLRRADGPIAPDTTPRHAPPGELQHLAGLKILVVDDEPIIREVIADMLRGFGCAVSTAENGGQALVEIDGNPPEAILLDFAMPGMNGAEVARTALARRPDLKIVFATGFAQSDAIDEAVGDAAIILRKPFSPGALSEALRKALSA
ncbi:ATP-binding protein [Rhizorhabdus argentea]|uniref:ATP-binding protein n=1 Tax=Rhizorhabdus argentea TaxID=1387174 RepID=UPI0030ECED47